MSKPVVNVALPTTIRIGQGSQFTSRSSINEPMQSGITLDFSRPGKLTDNVYVGAETFNATVRLECMRRHLFLDLDNVSEKNEGRTEYNTELLGQLKGR